MQLILARAEILSDQEPKSLMKLIEFAARTCYKSEEKITDTSYIKFIKDLIARGHFAMIEHGLITAKFYCDRGVSHELVRHRIASFGQESTRYCNYSKDKYNNSIIYIDIHGGIANDPVCSKMGMDTIIKIIDEWEAACEDAERHYFNMLNLGAPAQIARSVLNNSTKTEIVVSMNPREWRHFFELRALGKAGKPHPQMYEVARPLLDEFVAKYPPLFEDLIS